MLAALPTGDKLVLFGRYRKVMETMAANLDRATAEQRAALVANVIRRVVAKGKTVTVNDIEWAGPVKPFVSVEVPPDGLEPPPSKAPDPLAWYAAAGS